MILIYNSYIKYMYQKHRCFPVYIYIYFMKLNLYRPIGTWEYSIEKKYIVLCDIYYYYQYNNRSSKERYSIHQYY